MRTLLISSIIFLVFSGDMAASGGGRDSLPASPRLSRIIPGVAGLAVASFIVDEPLIGFFRSNQSNFLNSAANITDMGGEKRIVVPALLLTYGSARFLFRDDKLHTASLNAIQSVIVTAIATEGTKIATGRARPFTGDGAYAFQPFPGGVDRFKSLPSGHASLAFAVFTPFAETYTRWIYLVPVSVAAGRVYQDKHWMSDVLMGGGFGLVSGILFTHHPGVQIIPSGLRVYF